MKLSGRISHIAGSASNATESSLIDYGHNVIKSLVRNLLREGGKFLVQVGKEPAKIESGRHIPLIFDWTILAVIYEYLRSNKLDFTSKKEKPIITVVKQDFEDSIPENRRNLWEGLRKREAVQIEFLEEGWSSGAVRRIRMSEYGDLLIILSGGEGVEHLAEEYNRHSKPIIPLDLNLGANKNDGSGGAPRLFSKMLRDYKPFLTLENTTSAGELFLGIKTNNGSAPFDVVANGILALIRNIVPPIVFYVRLMANDARDYTAVEYYFRHVVSPFFKGKGFSIKEIGVQETSDAWMNVEIFESLHRAAIVVVDLTGLRPNCLIELGYAFGRPSKIILTAKKDYKLPFDTKMYECLFWDPSEDANFSTSRLGEYYERNINRPPIVRTKDLI
jgi:hypothetical protein